MTKKGIWSKKSQLDEMQELTLLKIESRGFWIGFLGLFIAIAAQVFLYGAEVAKGALTGEFIVFLCMGIYLMGECLHNGIWDRHLSSTPSVNICLSLLAAVVTALFNAILSYRNYHDLSAALIVFFLYFLLLSVALSAILCIGSALYHRKRKHLEEDTDEKD